MRGGGASTSASRESRNGENPEDSLANRKRSQALYPVNVQPVAELPNETTTPYGPALTFSRTYPESPAE